MLPLSEIVAASKDVAATRSRKQKVERLKSLIQKLEPGEVRAAVGFLCGELRQGKLGVGYRSLQALRAAAAATAPSFTVNELDAAFQTVSELSGKCSSKRLAELLREVFVRLTSDEQDFVSRLMVGELRQGALEALVVEAVGAATGISPVALRR